MNKQSNHWFGQRSSRSISVTPSETVSAMLLSLGLVAINAQAYEFVGTSPMDFDLGLAGVPADATIEDFEDAVLELGLGLNIGGVDWTATPIPTSGLPRRADRGSLPDYSWDGDFTLASPESGQSTIFTLPPTSFFGVGITDNDAGDVQIIVNGNPGPTVASLLGSWIDNQRQGYITIEREAGDPPISSVELDHTGGFTGGAVDYDRVSFDNCPDNANPLQEDNDDDGFGDVCDLDDDNDGVEDLDDNCPIDANVGQLDDDFDGLGNSCDTGFTDNAVVLMIQDTIVEDVDLITTLNPPGGTGMIKKLTGKGGVNRKAANAVKRKEMGTINETEYEDELIAALNKENAFANTVSTKPRISAADKKKILDNSTQRKDGIQKLKANF